jgi:hypothetical protein
VRHDSARGFLVTQAEHRIRGASRLEDARLLEVLTLKEERSTRA